MALTADNIVIRRLTVDDAAAWTAMRHALWPNEDRDLLAAELTDLAARSDFVTFGAFDAASGTALGLIEVGERSIGEGCETSPVGYIEALWVDAAVRQHGIARQLVATAIDWSKGRGYQELGSDADLENTLSHNVHERLGFTETERLVTFRMDLRPAERIAPPSPDRARPALP